jgi:8-oxo-dGTP pyrophosphatase MutT (NUDIX family)
VADVREEISSGGVVIFGNAILLLKRYNGDWVLPKGKVKNNESLKQAAVREVFEEGGVRAEIIKYIGKINYSFRNTRDNDEVVNKTVHWFLMMAKNMECIPQRNEGFIDAQFIHVSRASQLAKYEDEKKVIIRAIEEI